MYRMTRFIWARVSVDASLGEGMIQLRNILCGWFALFATSLSPTVPDDARDRAGQ